LLKADRGASAFQKVFNKVMLMVQFKRINI
jgi:hypothetical protein